MPRTGLSGLHLFPEHRTAAVDLLSAGGHHLPHANDSELRTSLEHAVRVIQPIQHWIGGLKSELAGPLEAIHALTEETKTLSRLVLVVDDDASMRDLVARALRSAGYEVDVSSSVDEMLVVVGNRRPDLIIMDVMLPGIDGILGTRKLKAIPAYARIPVIMLTGQQNKQVIVDSMRAGAVDYVSSRSNATSC